MKKLATVAALAILTASSVSAEGFYVGAGISQENLKETGGLYKSTNAIALIGYEVNDMISVEAETSLPARANGIMMDEGSGTELSVYHTAVFAKFTLPTSGSIKPFARAGMGKLKVKISNMFGPEFANISSSNEFSYGIGAEWTLSEKFGLRVDYSMLEIEGADGEVFALSSVYRF